jgi:DNA-binding transcriptional MerR regulator
MRDEAYSIQQLATEARVSVATVKSYIYQGLVDRPDGPRCAPIYTNRHYRQLMRIRNRLEGNVRLRDLRDDKPYHTIKITQ